MADNQEQKLDKNQNQEEEHSINPEGQQEEALENSAAGEKKNTKAEAEGAKKESLDKEPAKEEIKAGDEQEDEDSPKEEDELTKLQEQNKELNDKYLRLYAEFENFRKRTNKERIELIQTAGASVITEMLPIIDDFERALTNVDKAEDKEAIRKGVELIYQKMLHKLEQKGLKPMKLKGEAFDPEQAEAVTHVPMGDEQKGKVVEEVEKGYYLHEKIIRHAKVVVGQ